MSFFLKLSGDGEQTCASEGGEGSASSTSMSEGDGVKDQNARCFIHSFVSQCDHLHMYACITNVFVIIFFSSDSELDYEKDEKEEEEEEEEDDEEEDEDEEDDEEKDDEEEDDEEEEEDIQDRFYTYVSVCY